MQNVPPKAPLEGEFHVHFVPKAGRIILEELIVIPRLIVKIISKKLKMMGCNLTKVFPQVYTVYYLEYFEGAEVAFRLEIFFQILPCWGEFEAFD